MIAIETLKVKLTGERPLLICNGELANPFNPAVKEISQVSQKKQKTVEDHETLSRLQFEAGCYFDESLGIYMPSANLFKAIQEGAARFKEGPLVKAGLIVKGFGSNGKESDPLGSTIMPDGHCTPRQLYDKKEHMLRRMGKLPGSRKSILITRPVFNEWEIYFQIEFADIAPARVLEYLKVAGRFRGLGTWRPIYGTFRTEVVK
jgi:hypothetical protein